MIQIRNVPDDLRRKLKARAALGGMSMSDYALRILRVALERPTRQELLARIAELRADKAQLLPFLAESAARADCFADIVPVSARRGTNVERLEALLVDCLPLGPAVFPPEQFTDRSERFLAAELIREASTTLPRPAKNPQMT